MGTNFLPANWAYATATVAGELGFIWSPTDAHWFDATSPYNARYGSRYLLTVLPGGDYRLNDPDTGTVYVFDAVTSCPGEHDYGRRPGHGRHHHRRQDHPDRPVRLRTRPAVPP